MMSKISGTVGSVIGTAWFGNHCYQEDGISGLVSGMAVGAGIGGVTGMTVGYIWPLSLPIATTFAIYGLTEGTSKK